MKSERGGNFSGDGRTTIGFSGIDLERNVVAGLALDPTNNKVMPCGGSF